MTDEQVRRMLQAVRDVAESLNGEGYHTAMHAPTQAALDVRFLLAHFDRRPTFLEEIFAESDGAPEECEYRLKRCPFCDGRATLRRTPKGGAFVDCDDCGASSKLVYGDKCDPKALVIEAWNNRKEPCEHEWFDADLGDKKCNKCGASWLNQ